MHTNKEVVWGLMGKLLPSSWKISGCLREVVQQCKQYKHKQEESEVCAAVGLQPRWDHADMVGQCM